jgi:hypothetical protein
LIKAAILSATSIALATMTTPTAQFGVASVLAPPSISGFRSQDR